MYSKNNNVLAQHGSSLLETMVSLFVLAIGLLGTLAMQTKSIQHNQNSYSYSQTIVLATDLSERLKTAANPTDVETKWKEDVAKQLPNGSAETEVDAGVKKITLIFAESAAGESAGKSKKIEFKACL